MKTTLNLDDRLLREAKKLAAERGVTLTQVFREALTAYLTRPSRRGEGYRFDMPTVRDARLPDVDISDRDAVYDLMERRP